MQMNRTRRQSWLCHPPTLPFRYSLATSGSYNTHNSWPQTQGHAHGQITGTEERARPAWHFEQRESFPHSNNTKKNGRKAKKKREKNRRAADDLPVACGRHCRHNHEHCSSTGALAFIVFGTHNSNSRMTLHGLEQLSTARPNFAGNASGSFTHYRRFHVDQFDSRRGQPAGPLVPFGLETRRGRNVHLTHCEPRRPSVATTGLENGSQSGLDAKVNPNSAPLRLYAA